MEKYNTIKHGCISGRYDHWSQGDLDALNVALQQPKSWRQIAEGFGRSVGSVRRQAGRMGLVKKYDMARGRPPKTPATEPGNVK